MAQQVWLLGGLIGWGGIKVLLAGTLSHCLNHKTVQWRVREEEACTIRGYEIAVFCPLGSRGTGSLSVPDSLGWLQDGLVDR